MLAVPFEASANNDWGMNPDDTTHSYGEVDLTDIGDYASNHGSSEIERSDIQVFWHIPPENAHDVRIYDNNYADSWYGEVKCVDDTWPPGGTCFQYEMRFNLRTTSNDNFQAANYKKLGCHEYGHTGGVDDQDDAVNHGSSCMRQGKLEVMTLEGHDIDIINGDV